MPYYYLIIFIILAIFSLLEQYPHTWQIDKYMRIIAFFLIFSTSAFKYETGVDWYVYTWAFDQQMPLFNIFTVGVTGFFSNISFEPGYVVLSSAVKQVGGSIQSLYFIIALINIVLLYKSLTFFSNQPILCLLFYYSFIFFILDMSGIRQSLALNIFLYGLRYVYSRQFWKYMLFIILAALFHQTAALFILIYFLFPAQRIKPAVLISIFFAGIMFIIFQIKWIDSLTLYILPFLNFGDVTEKIMTYVFSGNYLVGYNIGIPAFVGIISVIYFISNKNRLMDDPMNSFVFLLFIVYMTFYNFMYQLEEISVRFCTYFIVFTCVIITRYINTLQMQTNKLAITSLVIIYCFFSSGPYLIDGRSTIAYSPYQNYIIYKVFNIQSTGEERLNKHIEQHDIN